MQALKASVPKCQLQRCPKSLKTRRKIGKNLLWRKDSLSAKESPLRREAGVHPTELKLARVAQDGPGIAAEATDRQATLQIGEKVWHSRLLTVMNLAELSRLFHRKIDGILGLDILIEFRNVSIDYRHHRLVLTSDP